MIDTASLKAFLRTRGVPLSGVGALHEVEAGCRDGFPLAVVLAAPLDKAVLRRVFEADRVLDELAGEYQRVNAILKAALEEAIALLKAEGFRAGRMDEPYAAYDRSILAARLTHKMCATRAGLGWIGKSGLLVTHDFGPAVRLATLLTDAPLEPDTPVNESSCGGCPVCAKTCPAGAIKGGLWRLGAERGELLDPFACQAYRLKVAAETGWPNPRCGKCIAACPRARQFAGY